MSYVVNPTTEQGGTKKVIVTNDDQKDLLERILKELRLSNAHLGVMTEEDLTE